MTKKIRLKNCITATRILLSEFVKDQISIVRLVASDVLVELSGPQTANNAEIIVYTAKYQNNSDQT